MIWGASSLVLHSTKKAELLQILSTMNSSQVQSHTRRCCWDLALAWGTGQLGWASPAACEVREAFLDHSSCWNKLALTQDCVWLVQSIPMQQNWRCSRKPNFRPCSPLSYSKNEHTAFSQLLLGKKKATEIFKRVQYAQQRNGNLVVMQTVSLN